jgi:hypothetical protein
MALEALRTIVPQKHVLIAVLEREADVVAAMQALRGSGIPLNTVSILALDIHNAYHAIAQLPESTKGAQPRVEAAGEIAEIVEDATPKGLLEAQSMAIGGGIGFALGLISMVLPGVGPVLLAAGPIVMAVNILVHTVAGGVGLGMLLGAIMDERATEDQRDYLAQCLNRGYWLLVVHGAPERLQGGVKCLMQIKHLSVQVF